MTAAAIERVTRMKAVVHERYGGPDVLQLKDVASPELADDGILVRVRAAALNRLDWYDLTGTPWFARALGGLRRPRSAAFGHDFAGVVEAVGKDVEGFEPGDEVFGASAGALAELVQTRIGRVAPKPANLTFEEAAAVPIAALTALQGLRDHGGLAPGQTVLVHGASGGVGTFGVQIAKDLGAEVTAVCSTKNVEQARSLGADEVIDYTKDDVARSGRRFDVILHVGGRMPWSTCKRLLERDGKLVLAGASTQNRLFGPLAYIGAVKLASWRARKRVRFFVAKFDRPDLDVLRELLESGRVRSVVEQRYELAEVTDALRHLGEGHPRGKIVISV